MSYSDEIPNRASKPVHGKPNGSRRGEHVNPAFQSPPPQAQQQPAPPPEQRPPANTPMPAPRQQPIARQVPAQPVQRKQRVSTSVSPNVAPAPIQPQTPHPQPAPQQNVPAQPQQPVQTVAPPQPATSPPAKTQPAKPATPAAEPPKSTISIGKERPKAPADNSTHSFVSGSNGVKADPKDLLLDTDGLVKIYDGRTVVNGVNINVKRGEIVGLLGPNGAGKTTSFYMMVGLVPPNGGRVVFDGQDVTKLPMYKRARLGMGYLPQEESIFRKLTVEENIMAVMQTMNYSRKEKKAKCDELLERFSITHIRKNIAMACSGGEKRRVTIARSLVPNPSLIMLDEPFGGVDPIAVGEIQGIVKDLRKDGLAVLITDHNARETLDLVDRAYLICEGKVLREGPKEFLVNDPVSRQLYLGERFSM